MVESKEFEVTIDEVPIVLDLWDTAGDFTFDFRWASSTYVHKDISKSFSDFHNFFEISNITGIPLFSRYIVREGIIF